MASPGSAPVSNRSPSRSIRSSHSRREKTYTCSPFSLAFVKALIASNCAAVGAPLDTVSAAFLISIISLL